MKTKNKFPDFFRELQIKFSRYYANALNRAQLSISQYALLNYLTSAGCIPMTEVGQKLHITKPAVTHLVDRLEEFKFLKRIEHPKDRRVYLLKVLPKGVRAVRKIQKNVLGIVSNSLNRFKSKERKIIIEYHDVLKKLVDQVLDETERK